jgi:arylsulfatase A-like enzyme
MLSCAGNRWLTTPAMDCLAQTGARFERAYCVHPSCVPSRTGMFTGYTPGRLGIQEKKDYKVRMPADIQQQAMGSLFRNAGYETAYGGKDHVVGGVDKCGFAKLKVDSSDESTAAACVAFLKQKHDKPFLLVASFVNPHDICYLESDDSKRAMAGSHQAKKGKAADDDEGDGGKVPKAHVAAVLQRRAGISDEAFYAKDCPPLPANFEPQADAPDALRQYMGEWGETNHDKFAAAYLIK